MSLHIVDIHQKINVMDILSKLKKKAISDYCNRMNYTILRFYIDEAKTGMNDNREEFQAMIADSSSKEFSAVIVHKLDRFSRDRYNSVFYRKN